MSTLILKKRFFSSPVAFATTVNAFIASHGADLDEEVLKYDEVLGSDADDLEEGLFEQPEMETLRTAKRSQAPLTKEDQEDLSWLAHWGASYESVPDSRLRVLLDHVEAVVRPAGVGSNERIVVFTEYVATLGWIRDILIARGYDKSVVEVIEGSTPADDRELIRARFNENPAEQPVRILLATDAAGEGIDLQHYCHRLVNFDIPFNPNRLEQRIGRIDRYGQQETSLVHHFMPEGSSPYSQDVEFLRRIAVRIARVELDLGSANEIIAPDLTRQLGIEPGTAKPKPRKGTDDDTVNRVLHDERILGQELTSLEEQLSGVREQLHLDPTNLIRVVETALDLSHEPALVEVGDDRTDERVFEMPPGLGPTWASALDGLRSRLEPDKLRPIVFESEAAQGRSDLVYAHMGHPIVQRAARALRAQMWGHTTDINRVSAVVVDGLDESVVAAIGRLVLVGASGVRLHEEVFLAGTRLDRRQDLGVDRAESLLISALDGERLTIAPPTAIRELAERWNANDDPGDVLRSRVTNAVTTRAERRRVAVTRNLESRESADLARVDEVFSRFATTLTTALERAEQAKRDAEATLFALDEERQQYERDLRAIRGRLDHLNEERDTERAAVAHRYLDVKSHTFAAALVFAITPADAESWGRA